MTKRTMWTPEELDTLRLMYGLGIKYEEIARVLDRTPAACMQRASMMGIVKKRGEPLPIDEPVITHEEMYVTKPRPTLMRRLMRKLIGA